MRRASRSHPASRACRSVSRAMPTGRASTSCTNSPTPRCAAGRDEHVQGWRYQLSLFSNAVTNDANSGASASVDRWFAMWSEPDAGARERTLRDIAIPTVTFRDQFSLVDGIEDLVPHIGAA